MQGRERETPAVPPWFPPWLAGPRSGTAWEGVCPRPGNGGRDRRTYWGLTPRWVCGSGGIFGLRRLFGFHHPELAGSPGQAYSSPSTPLGGLGCPNYATKQREGQPGIARPRKETAALTVQPLGNSPRMSTDNGGWTRILERQGFQGDANGRVPLPVSRFLYLLWFSVCVICSAL